MYNSFYVAVTTASHRDSLSFTDLHCLLMSHESLLKTQTTTSSVPSLSSPTTFYKRPTSNGYNPNSSKLNYNTRSNYQPNRPPFRPNAQSILPTPRPAYTAAPFNPNRSPFHGTKNHISKHNQVTMSCVKFLSN